MQHPASDTSCKHQLPATHPPARLKPPSTPAQVRLLELKVVQLEGSEEGSGPLEEDQRLLQQNGLAPRHRACIVYRWAGARRACAGPVAGQRAAAAAGLCGGPGKRAARMLLQLQGLC